MKPKYFQVCIRILEARHLAWSEIDTQVGVQVDKEKQYTAVRRSTDRPYYNEHFTFKCYTSPTHLMDKIITLSVYHIHGFGFHKKLLGCVRFDVATVWKQPDHQFYHKWAVLQDRNCKKNDVRGFLKCDVTVIGEGETVNLQESDGNKDEDDIEGNLLMPDGVTSERQRARYTMRVYRADIVSSTTINASPLYRSADHINPFVRISFAGLKGETTKKKNVKSPIWNEELIFYDSYPPLWQRIRLQLRNSDRVGSSLIAEHVLDLSTISSLDFLPTFGPTFVNLYECADMRTLCSALSPASPENGQAYRGRLLLAVHTETLDSCATSSDIEPAKRRVIREAAKSLNERECWKMEEILLVGVVWDISMLKPDLKRKQVSVEISFGDMTQAGQQNVAEPAPDGISRQTNGETEPNVRSATMSRQPVKDGNASYSSVSYGSKKPCVFTSSWCPDVRHRLHHSNLLAHLAHELETAIARPPSWISEDEMETLLRDALSKLRIRCADYLSITPKQIYQENNSTNLDKMRIDFCRKEVENAGSMCRKLEVELRKDNMSTSRRQLQRILQQLRFLAEDPQHSLPDVFVSLVADKERLAVRRIPARHLIFSTEPDKRGIHCGRLQSIIMKGPEKKDSSPEVITANIDIALWLGPSKHRNLCFDSLPTGYEPIEGFGSHPSALAPVPTVIRYAEKNVFECRAFIYQGWLKQGSDKTALCDSFVRIVLGSQNKDTKVVSAKLDPTWDETLVFWDVILYGSRDYIKLHPPTIMIEVLDKDVLQKKELVGRATASPQVKLLEESYSPPRLKRYSLFNGDEFTGEMLAAFHLLELSGDASQIDMPEQMMQDPVTRVPPEITPKMMACRIEVLFWGIREMKHSHLFSKMKPRVVMECGEVDLKSTVIQNIKETLNFDNPVLQVDTMIPEERMYCPCITFTVYNDACFLSYFGTHVQPTVARFLVEPETQEQWAAKLQSVILPRRRTNCTYAEMICDETSTSMYEEEDTPLLGPQKKNKWALAKVSALFKFGRKSAESNNETATTARTGSVTDNEEIDWWTKYYSSKQGMANASVHLKPEVEDDEEAEITSLEDESRSKRYLKRRKPKVKIYPNELEAQPDFNGFNDTLQTFDIFKGKRTGDELLDRENIVAQLKGTVKVYRWPPPRGTVFVTENGLNVAQGGLLQDVPSNAPVKLSVRVYVVRAFGLCSRDLNGKSDPYLTIKLGSRTFSDKVNYFPEQLDPTFGRCFEIEAILPRDNMLTVRVMDFDIAGLDDIVGETSINLENRYYSRHRAACGLASSYEVAGYNRWRDVLKPSQILQNLCKKCNISGPKYIGGHIVLGDCDEVKLQELRENPRESEDEGLNQEELALYALRRWHKICRGGHRLVPEHVETRSLFHPKKPGIEQGKLEMWVDMFPVGEVPLPPPVDITPPPPQEYELRVIIWNTEDVILQDDSFLIGEKMSDIFVKGWLVGDDVQTTDVHYRSLTGEGNFNWRFIFRFKYHAPENKIIIAKKDSLFIRKLSEHKIPCRLHLQIWDNDFIRNDLLGSLTFDLGKMPRGARSCRACGLNIVSKHSPRINLFKMSHFKGWWPFQNVPTDGLQPKLTGKLEAEFILLTKEEADRKPAGIGRSGPDPLGLPKRPETSFLWLMNPMRSFKHIILPHFKGVLLISVISIIIFICLFLLIRYLINKVTI